MGPHTYEYIISSLSDVLWGKQLWKLPLVCLHWTHSWHTVSRILTTSKPLTIVRWISWNKSLKFRCPRRKCHNHSTSFSIVEKHWCFTTFITTRKVLFLDKFALITNLLLWSNMLRLLSSIFITNPFCKSWPKLSRLVFSPGTYSTSSITTSLLSVSRRTILPDPSTIKLLSSANLIFPLTISSIFTNHSFFPVIWVKQTTMHPLTHLHSFLPSTSLLQNQMCCLVPNELGS